MHVGPSPCVVPVRVLWPGHLVHNWVGPSGVMALWLTQCSDRPWGVLEVQALKCEDSLAIALCCRMVALPAALSGDLMHRRVQGSDACLGSQSGRYVARLLDA